VLCAVAATAAQAVNDNTFLQPMTCDDGTTVTIEIVVPDASHSIPNTFRIVDSTATFAWRHYQVFSPSGEPLVDLVTGLQGASNQHDLVTCGWTGRTSGNQIIVTGFFTPAG
jgi:hypothetical protein